MRKESTSPRSMQGKIMQGKTADDYHVIMAGKKRDRFHIQISVDWKTQ